MGWFYIDSRNDVTLCFHMTTIANRKKKIVDVASVGGKHVQLKYQGRE